MTDPVRPGQNGGPLPDEPAADSRPGQCKHCRHWQAPPEREQRAFERFRLGLSRQRDKRPELRPRPAWQADDVGLLCDDGRVRLPQLAAASPKAAPEGSAFVTISRHGHIVWQGPEDRVPVRFKQ